MVNEDSSSYRTTGNAHHLQRQFAQAVECYSKGLEADPSNHLLLGNKSASLFEMGEYSDSSASAKAALSLEAKQKTESEKWRLKLVSRVVSCAIQLCVGQDSLTDVDPELLQHDDVAPLVSLLSVERDEAVDPLLIEATRVFTRPTIMPIPTGFEYFPVGHDPSRSLVSGNEGLRDQESTRGVLMPVPATKLKDGFSVLMGGCGDARHMYATLDDLVSTKPLKNVRLKFLLNDKNPTILARQILILAFSMKMDTSKAPNRANTDFIVNLTVLTYLYVGAFDPVYTVICEFARDFDAAIKKYVPFVSLYDTSSRASILRVFRLWKERSPKFSAKEILVPYNRANNAISNVPKEVTAQMSETVKTLFENSQDPHGVSRMSDKEIDRVLPGTESLDQKRLLLKAILKDGRNRAKINRNLFADSKFLALNKCLLPPVELPGLRKDVKEAIQALRFGFCENGGMDLVSPEVYSLLKKYVNGYKANPVMVDFDYWDFQNGNVPRTFDVKDVTDLFTAHRRNEKDVPGIDVFDFCGMVFFNAAATLKGCVVDIEMHVGCMFSLARELGEAAKKFDRITVNNIPDYSGLLNSLLHLPHLLKPSDSKSPSFMLSNCLLNTGIWKDYNEYIYSSCALSDKAEVEFLTGIKFLCGDLYGDDVHWILSPTKTIKGRFNSRDSVVNWLHRLLLMIVYPAPRELKSYGEATPLTLNTFLLAIERLAEFVPGHWLSQILQDILESKVVLTKAVVPTSSPNKRPATASNNSKATRTLNKTPIEPELLALTALWAGCRRETFPPLLFQVPHCAEISRIHTPKLQYKPFTQGGAHNVLGIAILPARLLESSSSTSGNSGLFGWPGSYKRANLYATFVNSNEARCFLFSTTWIVAGADMWVQLGFVAPRKFLDSLKVENGSRKGNDRYVLMAFRVDNWDVVSESCTLEDLQ
ncbi:hypothetical protein BDR26DRAFT_854760 [Obelidium mucronatum]|nr:hypothetical protein BDR26DRAFT_854760 [Obelidium mucronatum]